MEAESNPEMPQNQRLLEQLSKVNANQSLKWGGSLTFVQRYVSSALKRISSGPKELVDPEQEFIQLDIEDYLKYKCKELTAGEKY
jgi:hypothetical protein